MDTLDYNCSTPCPKCGSRHVYVDPSCILTSYPAQYRFICTDCDHVWTSWQESKIGRPITSWPDSEPGVTVEPLNYGWICPKCGRVYSPSTSQCLFCGGTYSPNIVYCGPNNGTKDVLDTMNINNTTDSSKNKVTQSRQSNSLKYESFMKQHGE